MRALTQWVLRGRLVEFSPTSHALKNRFIYFEVVTIAVDQYNLARKGKGVGLRLLIKAL